MVSSAQFLALLKQSKLLPADELEGAPPESSAEETARGFVERGRVTRWQAEQLLAGRHQLLLGKYQLLDKLGEGGMGAVYKARQTSTGRLVALKLMTENVVKQPGALQRFHREIRAAAALDHPNIVAALDADQAGNLHFLVMEYAEGRDLKEWIKEFGRLPIDWSCECIRQTALGLQHAHERGLAHRDIKPSNLLVVDDPSGGPPTVKILDMGLARFTSEVQCTVLTQTGQVLGTIDYISPEQAKDTKGAGIIADIFSLGASLFHMLTGQVPFGGKSPMEKLMARAIKDAPRASTLRPDIPAGLDEVIARMLARNVEARYQTPEEVVAALVPFCPGAEDAQPSSSLTLPKSQGAGSTIGDQADATLGQFLSSMEAQAETPLNETADLPAAQRASREPATAVASRRWIAVAAGFGLLAVAGILWMSLGRGSREVATPKGNVPAKAMPSGIPPPTSTPVEQRAFVAGVAGLPLSAQISSVREKLQEINPGFDGKGLSTVYSADGKAVRIAKLADDKSVKQIWPLVAFRQLQDLDVHGTGISSLEPLRGLPLERLDMGQTEVSDLSPLEGMPLKRLEFYHNPVTSLESLRSLKQLTHLDCWHAKISDLSPLAELPLELVNCGGMETLNTLEGLRGHKTLNTLNFSRTKVASLAPLTGMPMLSRVDFGATPVASLEPLRGLKLKSLGVWCENVSDLSPLAGMQLETLTLMNSRVTDLRPLAGMPLFSLSMGGSQIADLSPLRGMKLTYLECSPKVTDLSAIEGMPLEKLFCARALAAKHAVLIQGIKTLTTINQDPALVFWRKLENPSGPALSPEQRAFLDQVAKLPENQRNAAVQEKLREVNPGFDGRGITVTRKGALAVEGFKLIENKNVKEVWPLRAFPTLVDVDLHDTGLTSVESLRGLKLTRLDVGLTEVSDLTPLEGMPLEHLKFYFTPVSDLKPLIGMPLKKVDFWATKVTDLSPLAQLPLSDLGFGDMPQITSLEALRGLKLTELNCSKSKAVDLEPLRGMPLTNLGCGGNPITSFEPLRGMPLRKIGAYSTKVTDLTPLADLPLTDLWLNNTPVADLRPLARLKLAFLNLRGSKKVKDLSPLAGMPLRTLWISDTPVESLEPLRGMALENLDCRGSAVTNLSPLQGMSLKSLECDDSLALKHAEMLQGMKTLTKLNDVAPEAFWKKVGAGGAAASSLSPEQQEFVDKVATLPPGEQVSVVTRKVQEVNPAFRGSTRSQVVGNAITQFHIADKKGLAVIWPLRALSGLTALDLSDSEVADVSSLAGLKLKDCNLSSTKVADLRGLEGMPLERVNISFTKVASLTPLGGAPLVELRASGTQVESLEPLRGAKLTLRRLSVYQTRVTGLEPLIGMQLEHLDCGEGQVASLEPLRGMPLTLLYVNNCAVKDLAPLAGMPLVELHAIIGFSTLPKFKDGTLRALDVRHSKISDLSSLANQPNLESLNVEGTGVSDLSPLAKLPKLAWVHVGRTKVADLTPLNGKRLTWLACPDTQVTNLSAVAGMPLVELYLGSIPVDLGPLAPLPLKALFCDAETVRKHAETIQQIKSLQQINGVAVAEFWKGG